MRRFFVSTVVLLIAGMAFTTASSTAGLVDQAKPLKVKIAPFAGGKKVQVKKKLAIAISCNKDCRVKATYTLKTPVNSSSVKGGTDLAAGDIWKSGMVLTTFGRNYLKANFRDCRFKVRISALDIETNKRTIKTKTFRFYR